MITIRAYCSLRIDTLNHVVVLRGFNQLLFELIQLAEVLIRCDPVVLIDIELIELAWRIRSNMV